MTPPTILVIDDESIILGVMASSLRHAGFQVETAASVEEAVAVTRRNVPDLIVSDVVMPELEGPALITQLKDAGVACPVMFTSGDPSFRVMSDSLDVPGATFLPKPFTPIELVDAVLETLGQR